MIDQYFDSGSSGRDGYYNISGGYSGTNYNTQPVWNKRYATSNRRGSSRTRGGYSRDSEKEMIMQRLDNLYQSARDDQEADMIQNIMSELSR